VSGDYRIHCSCGASKTLDQTKHYSIETAAKLAPHFELLAQEGWEISDMRGNSFEPAGELVLFVLEHWRHGELSYDYTNNNEPPIKLEVAPDAGLPEPCPRCRGRRLIPCPEC
jgi:hypothetical protein